MADTSREAPPPGAWTTLRAALNAGLVAGFVFGIADGVVAGWRTHTSGVWTWTQCLAASVATYALVWTAVLFMLSPIAHFLYRKGDVHQRLRGQLALILGLGAFLELYWWTRPYVYPGLSATDSRRLLAAGAMFVGGAVLGMLLVALGRRLPRALHFAGAALAPIAFIAGCFVLLLGDSHAAARGTVGERTRAMPNVLLFVCDALRADVLGCYGNERVKTPTIDALAARGVLFERAMVQAPFTWSSFGSILTGKYPRRHGLLKMAADVRMPPNLTLPLHLKSARILSDGSLEPRDVTSATFMTGTLSHGSGLLQGFDAYFEALAGHDLVEVDVPWSVFRSELLVSLLRNKMLQKIDSAPVAKAARDWFAKNGKKRFCAMVHFYSTHTPYDPPAKYRAMYVDPAYDGPVKAFYAEHRIAIETGKAKPTEADARQIANLYYGGVSQADAMIGEVLAELERQGVLENTLVIVTGDHGEELGDHGLWEHNHMFQTNLRVPLVLALPGKLPAAKRVGALVESVDLVPTVCELLGIEVPNEPGPEDERGRKFGVVDGTSLVPLARGEVERVKEFSFAENGRYLSIQDLGWKLVVPSHALTPEGWQQATSGAAEKPQLYDLGADPNEKQNAFEREPEQVARLLAALRDFDLRMPIRRSQVVESDRDVEQRLQQLGYAGGVGSDTGEDRKTQ